VCVCVCAIGISQDFPSDIFSQITLFLKKKKEEEEEKRKKRSRDILFSKGEGGQEGLNNYFRTVYSRRWLFSPRSLDKHELDGYLCSSWGSL